MDARKGASEMARSTALKVARVEPIKRARKRARKQQWTPARKVAMACGGVGGCMLALSMVDCTHALIHLGMSGWLAPLMAAGIDAGLVATEFADMVATEHRCSQRIKRWSMGYMSLALSASIMLNCLGAWQSAPVDSRVLATVFGAMVPCMVAIMGRIMGALMDE